jgi:hypothetical protein
MTPLQRETAVWQAVKVKDMDAFAASMSPDFVGVYSEGTHDRERELRIVRNQALRSFAIGNFHARLVDPNDMLVTYSADVQGMEDGSSFSGRYWNTSWWHQSGGKWLTVYHGESKAK